MLLEIPHEDFLAALDAVVAEVLLRSGVAAPPVDALVVARCLGIAVATDASQGGRGRFVRLAGTPRQPRAAILVRPDPRPERRQWAVAHEIGEAVAARVFATLAVDPREAPPNAREALASRFAARLLLPEPWFSAHAGESAEDLFELKRRYHTASHELIARRLLELAVPALLTIFDQGRITCRLANRPGRFPPPSPGEWECRRRAGITNLPQRLVEADRRLAAWPVHEEGWQREILRTTWDEFD